MLGLLKHPPRFLVGLLAHLIREPLRLLERLVLSRFTRAMSLELLFQPGHSLA